MSTKAAKSILIGVCELMGHTFTIPHYQRGYRWEEQEVNELLDDLWAFAKYSNKGEFYCLQPIVLRENDNKNFDVLDGQQRLTTLYLLLVYLEERRKEDNYLQPLFSLNYTTREKCGEFLAGKKFTNREIDSSNIDFHYICRAYQCIDKWFKDPEHSGAKSKMVSVLLEKSEKKSNNTRVIRYEVEKATNPIDVFIRLNVGKIPLTDAELTKALLLQLDKYPSEKSDFIERKLHNIAVEWDNIENTLQDRAFWYFLNNNSNTKETHIEFIFDLLTKRINAENKYFTKIPRKYGTFLVFYKHLENLIAGTSKETDSWCARIEAVERIWSEIIEYFEYFREWFQDRKLYHYIGLLIALEEDKDSGKIIDSLIQKAKEVSKSAFREYLETEIAKKIKCKKRLDKLIFENKNGIKEDYKDIKNILLLHNVYTTLESGKEKQNFPFEHYKNQKWSLEHIYARNSDPLTGTEKQKEWLSDHIRSLTNSNTDCFFNELLGKMKEMTEQDEIDNVAFEKIMGEVYSTAEKKSGFENDENRQLIKNLCLLDVETNSKLNNSLFDVKREIIKERELEGFYIPVCTRNVFLKAYTSYPATNTYWTKTDRDDYFKSIENVYNFFISKIKKATT